MRLVRWTKGANASVDKPATSAVRNRKSNLWLIVDDDDIIEIDAQILTGTQAVSAVRQRDDLGGGHPYESRRMLGTVPSGYPDVEVDFRGDITPVYSERIIRAVLERARVDTR